MLLSTKPSTTLSPTFRLCERVGTFSCVNPSSSSSLAVQVPSLFMFVIVAYFVNAMSSRLFVIVVRLS